jgi:putative heme iron utilization protein
MAANQERDFVKEAASLLVAARAGSLATVTPAGLPYLALVTPALDEAGDPLLLLSTLSAHTRHLQANPACALLVVGTPRDENPQTAPRLTISATAKEVDRAAARARYLRIHSYAELYVDFMDFGFWRLVLNDAHYVGGFAAAAQLDIAALRHEINALQHAGYG